MMKQCRGVPALHRHFLVSLSLSLSLSLSHTHTHTRTRGGGNILRSHFLSGLCHALTAARTVNNTDDLSTVDGYFHQEKQLLLFPNLCIAYMQPFWAICFIYRTCASCQVESALFLQRFSQYRCFNVANKQNRWCKLHQIWN